MYSTDMYTLLAVGSCTCFGGKSRLAQLLANPRPVQTTIKMYHSNGNYFEL